MDLKGYYRKLRETERGLPDDYAVVKSLPTADGGVAARLTEVTKAVAARMIVDGLAELAGPEEAQAFRKDLAERKKREEDKQAATRIQFAVLSDADMRRLRRANEGGSKD